MLTSRIERPERRLGGGAEACHPRESSIGYCSAQVTTPSDAHAEDALRAAEAEDCRVEQNLPAQSQPCALSRPLRAGHKRGKGPMSLWPFRRPAEKKSGPSPQNHARELRIATSGAYSIRASIEGMRIDGAGSYSQSGRVRAALFVPSTSTTVQFHAEHHKKHGSSARASCVHALQLFTREEAACLLQDVKRVGCSIGW